MSEPKKQSFALLVMLLGLLTTVGPMALDPFLPATTAIASHFQVDYGMISLSLTAIFFGNALGQIFWGPVSDRFGRKSIILLAISLYLISTLGCAWAPNIWTIITWRFLQGFVFASGRIVAAAAARDVYEREQLGKMLSYTLMIGGVISLFTSPTSGFLVDRFGWQSAFYMMAVFAALILILFTFFFRETLVEKDYNAINPADLFLNFTDIIKNRVFLIYVACGGFMLLALVAFLNSSSSILIGSFGVSRLTYGLMFSAVTTGFIIASIVGGRIVHRLGINKLILIGAIFGFLGATVMFGLAVGGLNHPLAVMLPMFFIMAAFSLLVPPATAGALSPFSRRAGAAASLQGFLQNLLGAFGSAFLALFSNETAIPMASVMVTATFLALAVYVLLIRKLEK